MLLLSQSVAAQQEYRVEYQENKVAESCTRVGAVLASINERESPKSDPILVTGTPESQLSGRRIGHKQVLAIGQFRFIFDFSFIASCAALGADITAGSHNQISNL